MANDSNKSKYFKNAKESQHKEKLPEYRKSVMTPKRARELAEEAEAANEAAEAAADGSADTAEEAVATDVRDAHEPQASAVKKEKKPASHDLKKTDYRKSVITPKRARELAAEAEKPSEITPDDAVSPVAVAEEEAPDIRRRGTDTDMFKGEAGKEKALSYTLESIKNSNRNVRKRAIIRMLTSMTVLTAVACVMQIFFTFRVPLAPKLFTIDFTPVPELMAAIAYGPMYGIAMCLVKNLVYVVLVPQNWISILSNLILDSLFVLISSMLYTRMMVNRDIKAAQKKKVLKTRFSFRKMLKSTLIASVIALVPQFLITRFISFPLLEYFFHDKFTMQAMLTEYQASVTRLNSALHAHIALSFPQIKDINIGILLINLPITFLKLLLSTVIASLLLRLFLPFMQFRDKKAKKERTTTRG